MGNKYTKREFTPAEIATIGEEYTRDTDPLSVQALRLKYHVGTDRMYALIRESGNEVRSSGEQLQAWHAARKRTKAAKATQTPKAKGTEAGSDAQLNNGYEFSTDKTRKPPKQRKAATTPRSRWIDVADFCDKCAGTFSIHAPAHVAGRAHVLWTSKHRCEDVG
jgi:hypothetical protein